MAEAVTPALVEHVLRELEGGMHEAFFHSVENINGLRLTVPTRTVEDLLFAMAMWTRGDEKTMGDVLRAIATALPGQDKAAWARSLSVVASELEAGLKSEAAALVMTMGERTDLLAAFLRGFLAESRETIALCNNGTGTLTALPGSPPVIATPGAEYHVLKSLLPVRQRVTIDAYRALSCGDGDVLLFEDDLRLCHGWFAALEAAKRQASRIVDLGFVWLMEAGEIDTPRGTLPGRPRDTAEPLVPVAGGDFIGMQAIWMPAESRRKIRPALEPLVFADNAPPFDLALRTVCEKLRLGIYASGRALVQHIRTDTNATPGFHHRATHLLGELY